MHSATILRRWAALLLPCQMAVLSITAGVAMEIADPRVPGATLLAQAPQSQQASIPPEVLGWWEASQAASLNGEWQQALALQQRVVAWMNANLPTKHPLRAQGLSELGNRYLDAGQLASALVFSLEAVEILHQQAKPNPEQLSDLAKSLYNLGLVYGELGRHQEALAAEQEAVAIYRQLAHTDREYQGSLAASLSNMGKTYRDLNRFLESLASTQEAGEILRPLARDDPSNLRSLAISLNNLGQLYVLLGHPWDALVLMDEALAIYRKLVKSGSVSLDYLAGPLSNLGLTYLSVGRPQIALAPMQEAVLIYRHLANSNPAFLPVLSKVSANLASFYLMQRNGSRALPLLEEAVKSDVVFLQSQLPLLPEAQRQKLVVVLTNRWQAPFSLAFQSDAGARLSLFTRLNRQGLLQSIQRQQALLDRSGPGRLLRDQISALTVQISNITLPEEQRSRLSSQRDQLEQELRRLQPQLKPQLVDPEQVARRLPADGALVEFQRFNPLDANPVRYGPARYLALVLTPAGAIHAVPLGDASELEPLIQGALQEAGAAPQTATPSGEAAQKALAKVRRRLFDPLLPYVGSAKRWFVSPDGEIHRVPLAALPARDGDPNGATLGEERQLQVITTGRELLEEPLQSAAGPATSLPLVMAAPDYEGRPRATRLADTQGAIAAQTRSSEDVARTWPVLQSSMRGGRAVARLLGTDLISGLQATTTRLLQVRAPRIVHIATHGFFLPDRLDKLDIKGPVQGFTEIEAPLMQQEDPQLRSGIVLAGANHPDANPNDDGRLTALEATTLELEGTQLVTLSACSTGVGSESTGEGVYGLQRSLRVAGARTTLLSLWKVNDEATTEFMTRYYALLLQGRGRLEALLAVQKQFRTAPPEGRKAWSHPYFWAAWQLSGDSGPLKGLNRSQR